MPRKGTHLPNGAEVEHLRVLRGWTQDQLADKARAHQGGDFSKRTIERIEKGNRATLPNLVAVAAALGVEVGEILLAPRDGKATPKSSSAPSSVRPTTEPLPPHLQSVFLSYARRDALDFTQRLAADLAALRYQVWFDRESIEKGGLFDVRIEQGIRHASVVLAIMTPGSVREESVCRDEIVFALNSGKTIVPLKVSNDAQIPLLLARRNWIDFTGGYEQGRDALFHYLAGDRTALLSPRLPAITGVSPIDFSLDIARLAVGFTGREWLTAEIEGWLRRPAQRAFVLVGEPGIGKSAVAAWLSRTRTDVIGVHFCMASYSRTLDPHQFVASLVGQLAARLPDYTTLVEARIPETRRARASDAFRELIVEPARQMTPPGAPLVLVVDSLDEAASQIGETVVDVLVQHARELPDWLRIVTTTRPEAPILEQVRALKVFELHADRRENRQDVRSYLEAHAPAGTAARLAELAAGNFVYARLVLDALRDGDLTNADLGRLAPGLTAFYSETFHRRFPDPEQFAQRQVPLLRALVAAQEPLSFSLLCRVAGAEPEAANQWLLELRTFLRTAGSEEDSTWALYHQSLADWLTSRDAAGIFWCPASRGHTRLAEVLADQWGTDRYALRHLVTHQVAAGKVQQATELLLNWRFMEVKVEAGLIDELHQDLERLMTSAWHFTGGRPVRREPLSLTKAPTSEGHFLRLISAALRIHEDFLKRHPTCLFQCLWNSGWWYDCPDAERHYEPKEDGWQGEGPPWRQPGPKLSAWLERWRREKEEASVGFHWVRSLRPPIEQPWIEAVLPGGYSGDTVLWTREASQVARRPRGEDLVQLRIAAFSLDGRHVVSEGVDANKRIWDAHNGQRIDTTLGTNDVLTVAAAVTEAPWDAIVREGALQIQSRLTGEVVAWFPAAPEWISSHPSEPLWAFNQGCYLLLIALEGTKRPI